MVKSLIIQMVCSASLLLTIVPTLAQILWEHSNTNLVKVERLKKMLNDKEVTLVEWVEEEEQWAKKEANLQA